MNKLEKILLIGLLTLALPFPAYAGDPVPGIDISLEQIPGGKIYQGTTDSEGAVVFPSIPLGTYQVIITSKLWTDQNIHDPGITFKVSGKVTVRGWDAQQKRVVLSGHSGGWSASETPTCSPISIKEEGVKREAEVSIKEEGVKRSQSPPDTKLKESASEPDVAVQELGVASLSKLNEGPVCTLIDVSEEGEIIFAVENHNSSRSNVNQ